jgi:integrase
VGRPRKASVALPAHVHAVTARSKEYYYYQSFRGTARQEERIKLPGLPFDRYGTPDPAWWQAYRAASGETEKGPRTGSFAALIAAFKESPEWRELSEATRRSYEHNLGEVAKAWGKLLVAGVEPKHILALRDTKQSTPAAANALIRTLSAVISWSIPRGYRADNPCRHVRKLKIGEGYAPWSWEQIIHFREHVSCPQLWWAAALALYSGQRQADDLVMQWSDLSDGQLSVVQEKTGKKLRIPMHRDLAELLRKLPRRSTTILTNTKGRPWTSDGFRASWSKEMTRPAMAAHRQAGLVFHGLRKSAVVFLLEAGCTDAEVSAITGQSRQMVEHYGRQVNQEKLAAMAVLKWEREGLTDGV